MGGGIIDVLVGIVFKGGETFWFVHTLFLIFCVLIPLKKYLNDVSVSLGLFLLILIREVSLFETIPTINGLLYYGSFFLMGYYVRKFYYDGYRKLLENGKNMVITFIMWLLLFALFPENNVVFNWYMPILMGSVFWGVSLRIKSSNVIYKLLKYYGLNSLQFYLFNGYALVISRMLVKNIHIGNIPVLVFSVFVCCMALLTIMVEITKKNKLISYLCGYGKK